MLNRSPKGTGKAFLLTLLSFDDHNSTQNSHTVTLSNEVNMIEKIRDPMSCLLHLFGAIAALFYTIWAICKVIPFGSAYTVSFVIFGVSLIMLYTASTVYHMMRVKDRALRILRRIDHTMIFFLIAGTYTPVCVLPLRGAWGWSILSIVWGLALLGAFMKIFWLHAPRALSTGIYLVMGWIVVAAFYPLLKAISTKSFLLLLSGGLAYTLGAIIYALKWPRLPVTWLGFHDIFHVFVLLGSTFHMLFMVQLFPA